MKMIRTFLAVTALGLPSSGLAGENQSISSHVISAGGGASAGGSYALTGTVGQPIPGSSAAGTYHLEGGFWSALQLVLPDPGESFAA